VEYGDIATPMTSPTHDRAPGQLEGTEGSQTICAKLPEVQWDTGAHTMFDLKRQQTAGPASSPASPALPGPQSAGAAQWMG
jgi:hypothetical protein